MVKQGYSSAVESYLTICSVGFLPSLLKVLPSLMKALPSSRSWWANNNRIWGRKLEFWLKEASFEVFNQFLIRPLFNRIRRPFSAMVTHFQPW
jgi:hypothetical protein